MVSRRFGNGTHAADLIHKSRKRVPARGVLLELQGTGAAPVLAVLRGPRAFRPPPIRPASRCVEEVQPGGRRAWKCGNLARDLYGQRRSVRERLWQYAEVRSCRRNGARRGSGAPSDSTPTVGREQNR